MLKKWIERGNLEEKLQGERKNCKKKKNLQRKEKNCKEKKIFNGDKNYKNIWN